MVTPTVHSQIEDFSLSRHQRTAPRFWATIVVISNRPGDQTRETATLQIAFIPPTATLPKMRRLIAC